MENRIISLFQLDSDRAEWMKFIDELKKLGYKQGSDFFPNPSGNASAMFKSEVANDPKIKKLREKYKITGMGMEATFASDYVKESTYEVGDKVKVWMGGGKKVLGEIKKVTFGDGHYLVTLAEGQDVQRSLHELEPFRESDKVVKKKNTPTSLDEAVDNVLEAEEIEEGKEPVDEDFGGMIDNTEDMLKHRKAVIGREMGNMSTDEAVEEALDMNEMGGEDKSFSGYSDCCGAPVYGETDVCPKCHEHTTVIPQQEEAYGTSEDTLDEKDNEYAICTNSVGSTAGTTKRSEWDKGDKERYDRCLDHVKNEDEEMESEHGEDADHRADFEKYLNGELPKPPTREVVDEIYESELKEYDQDGGDDYKKQGWVKVPDSSFIDAVAYDDEMETLYVRFKQYGVYEYYNVPESEYRKMLKAPSVGKYFHNFIKPKFEYARSVKYKKSGRPAGTGKIQRAEEMVGKPEMEEGQTTSKDKLITYIIDNREYIPSTIPIAHTFMSDYGAAVEKLSSYDEEMLMTLKGFIEHESNEGDIDYKMAHTMDGSEESEEGADMEEGMDEVYESKIPVKEVVEENFSASAEDKQTISNLAALKGWTVTSMVGILKESNHKSLYRILVEKKGLKATIFYDDDAVIKPWKWDGRMFNFMQEALDAVYIPAKEVLKESIRKERADIKSKESEVELLLEQQKYSAETKGLPEREKARREKRSQEILKSMMDQELLKRGFNR